MLNFREELSNIKEEKVQKNINVIVEEGLRSVLNELKKKDIMQFFKEQRFYFEGDTKTNVLFIKEGSKQNIIFQKTLKNLKELEISLTILKEEFFKQGYTIQGVYDSINFFVTIKP